MRMLDFAWRNVRRNRRRSALAASSVFLAIFMVIVLKGVSDGFIDSLVRNYTKSETGHVNVTTAGYRERSAFMPVDEYIENSDELARRIQTAVSELDPTAVVTQRVRFGVILASESGNKQAFAIAGDPEVERKLLMLDTRILPGGSYSDSPGTAIIGAGLASDLSLAAGDELKIVTQKADGGLGYKKLRITGIFKTGVNSMDGSLFQMGLEDARELLGLEGSAQQISILLRRADDTKKALAIVDMIVAAWENPGSLSVLPWTSIGEYPRLVAMITPVYAWMFGVVALLGAFIIANVMTMVVLERKREIGILMSMGMPGKRLLSLFLIEGTLLGGMGAVAGSLAGLGLNAFLSGKGMDMTVAMAGFSWPLDNIVYPSVSIPTFFFGIALGTAVSALVAYFPARKASMLPPVEAIRSV